MTSQLTQARPTRNLKKLIASIRLIVFDFDGVFTDNLVYTFEDGREAVRCFRSDGFGLAKLNRLGIKNVVISSEANPVVSKRCEKLGITCYTGHLEKLPVLKQILQENGVSFSQTAYVGNDINDMDCLAQVALPIVVEDAHPDTLAYARYQTKKRGGYGAVREIGDLFESALKGKK
ncbi:MAG: HAD hydrolase family protein [Candidatus Omnitrophica bacterium]|nr:HAD hydrolase family protein [Candidatus Omnitrophota bacterium]